MPFEETIVSEPMPTLGPGIDGVKLMHVPSGDVEALRVAHVAKHMHSIRDELIYVVSGRGNVLIGDRSYAVGPGDVVAIPHQRAHAISAEGAPMHLLLVAYPEDEGKDWIAR